MVRKSKKFEVVVGIKIPRSRSLQISLSKFLGSNKVYRSNGYIIIEVDDEVLPQITKVVKKLLYSSDIDEFLSDLLRS